MLQGLGYELNRLGVDCVILNNWDPHDVCVDIANKDGRIVLTKRYVYDMLAHRTNCYTVTGETINDQIRDVCRQFNIAEVR